MSQKINDGLTKSQRYYRNCGHLFNKERAKLWREKNPDLVSEFNRKSYWTNRDKRLAYKRDRQSIRNAREKNNPVHKIKDINRKHLRRTAGPGVTREQWDAIKASFNHRCAYCDKEVILTMDHIIPVSKGGLHATENIVPACRPCNASKGAKCG